MFMKTSGNILAFRLHKGHYDVEQINTEGHRWTLVNLFYVFVGKIGDYTGNERCPVGKIAEPAKPIRGPARFSGRRKINPEMNFLGFLRLPEIIFTRMIQRVCPHSADAVRGR